MSNRTPSHNHNWKPAPTLTKNYVFRYCWSVPSNMAIVTMTKTFNLLKYLLRFGKDQWSPVTAAIFTDPALRPVLLLTRFCSATDDETLLLHGSEDSHSVSFCPPNGRFLSPKHDLYQGQTLTVGNVGNCPLVEDPYNKYIYSICCKI